MSEMKDDEEMVGQDSPDDSENDLIDAEVEQEESSHSLENQNVVEDGELPQNVVEDGESPQNVVEDGESPQEACVDNNVELLNEAHLSDIPEGPVEAHPDPSIDANTDVPDNLLDESKNVSDDDTGPANQLEAAENKEGALDAEGKYENGEELKNKVNGSEVAGLVISKEKFVKESSKQRVATEHYQASPEALKLSFPMGQQIAGGDESGTEEEQAAFMKELENFFRERSMEFKPPKFYGEGLNCLKLWRAVTRLGGYDQVTSCKLWRQVGESFKPPKTCTTVSWSFRCFYEKALLDYERHNMHGGELPIPVASLTDPMSAENQMGGNQASGSGRARRDAAARAMQGWHSQRLLGNGEVGDPIIKDKNSISMPKREKQLKSVGILKRKKPSNMERVVKAARFSKEAKPHMDTMVVDVGPSADWVKINVRRTKDCFEVYALVPGLLREEVRVQSDPAGRLVISGEPEQPDNPWGVTPFKKVISLPSRIDPHQTSAVVTLHGQLFVRVPFEQSDL